MNTTRPPPSAAPTAPAKWKPSWSTPATRRSEDHVTLPAARSRQRKVRAAKLFLCPESSRNNGDHYRGAVVLAAKPDHGTPSNTVIEMPFPTSDYFDAGFPGASLPVRVASLHDAKVFTRRWIIRDKEPGLKVLLRHLEAANSSATADIAIRQLRQALAYRGMLITADPLPAAAPRAQ